jgi:hypothetical protein
MNPHVVFFGWFSIHILTGLAKPRWEKHTEGDWKALMKDNRTSTAPWFGKIDG